MLYTVICTVLCDEALCTLLSMVLSNYVFCTLLCLVLYSDLKCCDVHRTNTLARGPQGSGSLLLLETFVFSLACRITIWVGQTL